MLTAQSRSTPRALEKQQKQKQQPQRQQVLAMTTSIYLQTNLAGKLRKISRSVIPVGNGMQPLLLQAPRTREHSARSSMPACAVEIYGQPFFVCSLESFVSVSFFGPINVLILEVRLGLAPP